MAAWGNIDVNSNSAIWGPASVKLAPTATNRDNLYGNTTADVFITGQTIGQFGVAPNEMEGKGGLASVTLTAGGDTFTAMPTVAVVGTNTATATVTATVNIAPAGITVNTNHTSGGTGWANGDTVVIDETGGTNTTAPNIFVNTTEVTTVALGQEDGTGYLINETITLSGGAGDVSASFAVTNVSIEANTSFSGVNVFGNAWATGDSVNINAVGATVHTAPDIVVKNTQVQFADIGTANGTGYAVSDTITINSGTGTQAVLNVTAVSAATNVEGIEILTRGTYTVEPDLEDSATTTSGGGTGFLANLVMGIGELNIRDGGVLSVTPTSINYNNVSTDGSGTDGPNLNLVFAVVNVSLTEAGSYTETPGTVNLATTSDASGTGLLLNVTHGIETFNIVSNGVFTALPTTLSNNDLSTDGSGVGGVDLSFGVAALTLTANGNGYSSGNTTILITGDTGAANATATATLQGLAGGASGRPDHAGWVLRTVGSGGRAGRVQTEVLVAMGSMTSDANDDVVFPE